MFQEFGKVQTYLIEPYHKPISIISYRTYSAPFHTANGYVRRAAYEELFNMDGESDGGSCDPIYSHYELISPHICLVNCLL